MSSELLSGAVASEQRRASEVGTSILAAGGNAADAIIATILTVNTLAPYHSDIGGGGFAIIRDKEGRYDSLDFRHTAPAAANSEFYKNPSVSTAIGGAAVAVPGEIRGLEALHKKYGRLEWSKLFEGAIKYAKEGAEVGGDLYDFISRECIPSGSSNLSGSWMESEPMYASLFQDGQALPIGSIWKRPEYATTLEKIAAGGADVFYQGEIAEGIVKSVRDKGGLMTLDDLKNYRVNWNTPLSIKYRDCTLWAPPAPASGAIWLSAMGILSHFEPTESGSVTDLHRLTEALRLAYGQRTALGDPAYVPGLEEKQRSWLTPEALRQRASMISDEKTQEPDYYKPPKVEIVNDNGTSNITVADSEGLVISITTTVGLPWGSHIMVPGLGLVLNDSMDDFSVEGRPNATGYEPQVANYVYGGKRPLSSSCPYIVENSAGHVVLSGGAAGGSTIIGCNVQVARNVLDYDMTAAEAMRANRLHNQILPNFSDLERSSTHQGITIDGFSEEQVKGLEGKGHKIRWVEKNRSVPCAIKFVEGQGGKRWEAEGDPRKHDSGGSVFIAQ
ncbi:gamma-glutamyltransferase [Kwoniella shandongensis]|uniref:Glutathione hydrolase n=1 Tax=Kwoniella shandongensis TaxID=1734106 RepID=A0A5M6BZV6_9TREE|nr:gamma-glutamyltransferase [Kwoniella shandongensis]KAA5528417.1 gamma-glutamyltransferase [Kwoniella shandongensis]